MAKRTTRRAARTKDAASEPAEEADARPAGRSSGAGRPIWNGSITFGLVNVPVELRSAEIRDELRLQLLDARDHAPVGYVRRNKRTGEELSWDQIVRGFEIEKDRFVVVTDEDLKRANRKATQTIEILEFVDAASIPPLYFERPYYLAATGAGMKGYALLRETMRRTGKAGIAKVILHTREHLAALLVVGDVLVLDLLRFASELRDPAALPVPDAELAVRPGELELAERLVESMVVPFDASRHRDEYRDDLLAMVRRKARSGEAVESEEPEAADEGGAEVVDLMALLKRSVADRKREGGARAGPRKVTPESARTRRRKRAG